MKLKSSLNLIMGLVIVLGLLPALAVAAPAAAPASPQTGKIEDQLLDLFAVKGSSDFCVRFAEQADLSPAYSMGWDARGEFVVNTLTAAAERSQAQAKAYLDGRGLTYQTFIAGNDLYVYAGDQTAAESLSALPEVSSIRAPRTYYIDPILDAEPASPSRDRSTGASPTPRPTSSGPPLASRATASSWPTSTPACSTTTRPSTRHFKCAGARPTQLAGATPPTSAAPPAPATTTATAPTPWAPWSPTTTRP